MKNIYSIAIGALALAITATSCAQKIEMTQGAINQSGIVTTCIKSASTNLPLEQVQISPLANLADSVMTNKQGFAKMTVPGGAHKFQLAAKGYASIITGVIVKPLNGKSDTPIFGEQHEDWKMYPMTATLKGRVVLKGTNDQTNTYAQGATVRVIKVDGLDVTDVIETKTSADGLFSFTVPASGTIDVTINYTDPAGGAHESNINIRLQDGRTEMLESIFLAPITGTNFDYADIIALPKLPSDVLRVTFPVAIDRNKINVSINNSPLAPLNIALADEDRTLVITSKESDNKWGINTYYSFDISAKSVEGGNLKEMGGFMVK